MATACSKNTDNDPAKPATPGTTPGTTVDNPANNVVETKPPVQKGITVNVNGNIGGYQEGLPARYDSTTKRYPLLVCIHGIGELGNGASDLPNAAWPGTPGMLRTKTFPASFTVGGKNYSFIVIAPQFKAWPSAKDVNDMINYSISKYRIDTTRMYVSGLSMGGGVTWDYAVAYPSRIAAIVPMCGASGPSDAKAKKIADAGLAVWAFHNEDDPTVSVDNSKGWVSKINSYKPAIPAKLTLWPTGGHDVWTKATNIATKENNMNMYEWMLQYSRTAK
jgi:predicted peptidase